MATFSMGGRYARTYGGGMLASCSSAVASVVRGVPQPAAVLGVAAPALYLRTRDAVIAVLTSDAVRLPCAVVLSMLARRVLAARRAAGRLRGDRRRGAAMDLGRPRGRRSMSCASGGRPACGRLCHGSTGSPSCAGGQPSVDIGVPAEAPSLAALLGRGPGLTPSGDDVLAGYVLGCRAFGLPVPSLDGLHRTTALSAALLEYASAGVAVPEVAGGDRRAGCGEVVGVGVGRTASDRAHVRRGARHRGVACGVRDGGACRVSGVCAGAVRGVCRLCDAAAGHPPGRCGRRSGCRVRGDGHRPQPRPRARDGVHGPGRYRARTIS